MMNRYLWLLLLLLLLLPWPSLSAQYFTNKYDDQIQNAIKHYWPDRPYWKEGKAQLYQESKLDPTVCSSVGACGLAQFMPRSWDDITKQIGQQGTSPHDSKVAILAYAYYMAQLRHGWRAHPIDDAQDLAEASYNAGMGNILKAQKACNGSDWRDISECLPAITGKANAKQTTDYVRNIAKWWNELELMK